jgi:hypothetical protein
VSAGFALDCAGNEIVVPAPVRVKLDAAARKLFVALRYREVEEDAVTILGAGTQMGTIRERFALALSRTNPVLGHRELGPGTPGCGKTHPICLASLRRDKKAWTLARIRNRTTRV